MQTLWTSKAFSVRLMAWEAKRTNVANKPAKHAASSRPPGLGEALMSVIIRLGHQAAKFGKTPDALKQGPGAKPARKRVCKLDVMAVRLPDKRLATTGCRR